MNNIFSVKPPQRVFTHIVMILGACVMMVACLLAYVQQRDAYDITIRDGKENSVKLTNALSSYLNLSVASIDLLLRRASDTQYFNDLFELRLSDDRAAHLKMWVEESPAVEGMLITNEKGVIQRAFYKEAEKRTLLQEGTTIKDLRFFILHKMNEGQNLQVNPLDIMLGESSRYVVISRSLVRQDGSFGGVIAALMNVDYLTAFLHSIELGPNTRMVLALDDGMILAQSSVDNKNDAAIARFVASLAGRERGTLLRTTEEEVENDKYIITMQRLVRLPVTVSLLSSEEDILKSWHISRNNILLFLGIFALFIAVISSLAMIISRQVQQIRRSEKMALLSNQNTSKFITKMNYELRTPLNTIIGFSEMIHLGYFGPLNDKQKERVYDIYICGTYLLEFVHDILDIIREEEGRLVLSEANVAIAPIIEMVFRTVLPYAKKEGVNILCEEGMDILPEVKGDERKLRQSFLNLVTNMVKYTPSGGMVSVSGEIDAKGNMVIYVTSRGITLSPEDFSLAFSMSGQLNSSDTEGGGLALPLSKMFIERHGGKVTLHSTDGTGIVVRVMLPAQRVLRMQSH